MLDWSRKTVRRTLDEAILQTKTVDLHYLKYSCYFLIKNQHRTIDGESAYTVILKAVGLSGR